jgi:hypothetical protein
MMALLLTPRRIKELLLKGDEADVLHEQLREFLRVKCSEAGSEAPRSFHNENISMRYHAAPQPLWLKGPLASECAVLLKENCSSSLMEQPITWTGRVAVVVIGHFRSALQQLSGWEDAVRINKQRTGVVVDLRYHVWADKASCPDYQTLATLNASPHVHAVTSSSKCRNVYRYPKEATSGWNTVDPLSARNFPAQWWLVAEGLRELEDARSLEAYSLIMRTRTDVVHEPALITNFKALWDNHTTQASAAAGSEGRKAFVAVVNGGAAAREVHLFGWDALAFGTPHAMREVGYLFISFLFFLSFFLSFFG